MIGKHGHYRSSYCTARRLEDSPASASSPGLPSGDRSPAVPLPQITRAQVSRGKAGKGKGQGWCRRRRTWGRVAGLGRDGGRGRWWRGGVGLLLLRGGWEGHRRRLASKGGQAVGRLPLPIPRHVPAAASAPVVRAIGRTASVVVVAAAMACTSHTSHQIDANKAMGDNGVASLIIATVTEARGSAPSSRGG